MNAEKSSGIGAKERRPRRSVDARLLTAVLVFTAVWVSIGYRLFQVQVVDAAGYREAAEGQRLRVEETSAARGTIYDRQGRELAVSIEAQTIYANPRQIDDLGEAAFLLGEILGLDIHRLREKLDSSSTFVFVARQVEEEQASAVKELELAGIHFLTEPKRVYPTGVMAAHTVGFVDVDSKGIEGLEAQYDELLTGVPGRVVAERAPGGQLIPHGRYEVEPAVPGADLLTSLDREVQFSAYQGCLSTLERTLAERCTVVVLDPSTFEVLAMAVVPSFDPSDRTGLDPASGILSNSAVRSVYEPGSTQKAVTLSAAVEEGVVEWDSQYLVPDTIEVVEGACLDESVIGCYRDFTPHEPALMTVKDCVRLSSNVCTVKIGQDLGAAHLAGYLDAFGYGYATGIDFPGEAKGSINLPHGCPTCPSSASIGYSLSVSPLQMASVYATIANGGLRMAPRLVVGVVDGNGVNQLPQVPLVRVLSENAARKVRLLLKTVVDDGTGIEAAVRGYTVAGKTGTTRKFDRDLGVYTDDFVASFVGMAPADDPRLVVAVVVDSPRAERELERTGGLVAAPLFSEVMEASLHQMGVRPDAR